jgi:hypothetical protein
MTTFNQPLINAVSCPNHCEYKPVCNSELNSIELDSSVSASLKNPVARKLVHAVHAIWGGERSEEVDTFPKFNKYTPNRMKVSDEIQK